MWILEAQAPSGCVSNASCLLVWQVEREIMVQQNLKHENVLRLFKHFEAARIEG
jgi:hypothetical protein